MSGRRRSPGVFWVMSSPVQRDPGAVPVVLIANLTALQLQFCGRLSTGHTMNRNHNKHLFLPFIAAVPIWLLACGGSYPPPTERLADAQAAERSAREVGANRVPAAQLSLKLSQEQIALAQKAMEEKDNEHADALLIRAKADAELAIALAREEAAKSDHQEAKADSAAQEATNEGQGAVN